MAVQIAFPFGKQVGNDGMETPGRTHDLTYGNNQPPMHRNTCEAVQRRVYGLSGAPCASEGNEASVSNSGCCGNTGVGNDKRSAVCTSEPGVLGARSRSWSFDIKPRAGGIAFFSNRHQVSRHWSAFLLLVESIQSEAEVVSARRHF